MGGRGPISPASYQRRQASVGPVEISRCPRLTCCSPVSWARKEPQTQASWAAMGPPEGATAGACGVCASGRGCWGRAGAAAAATQGQPSEPRHERWQTGGRAPHVLVGLIFKIKSNPFQGKIDLSLIASPPANIINK